MTAVQALQAPVLAALRLLGRAAIGSPPAPRATGGYGLACRGGLILLFLIGLVVSFVFTGAGLAIMIIASLALVQYFLLQYRGALLDRWTMAWIAAAVIALIALILAVWQRWGGRYGTRGDLMILAAVLGGIGAMALVRLLFGVIFGPHHPESSLPEPHDPLPLWFWTGGVGPDRATVVARTADDLEADAVMVEYWTDGLTSRTPAVAIGEHHLTRVELTGLEADTEYRLRVVALRKDQPVGRLAGSFTSFPKRTDRTSFSMAFASCMSTGSKGSVFDTIAATEPRPRVFVVTGDLHYENISVDRPERFLTTYDRVHASHPQRRLYNSMAMAYVWDDHDYGDNDSDHASASKPAAQSAYRMAVPHYLEPDRAGSIHQEFSIGRVLVVMTDNRSERGEIPGHLVNPDTEQWLVERITDARWPVVIWVSPTPWISSDGDSDNWGAYPDQRQRIATAIGDRSANLVMVSGDAHMVAIDDGRNAGYAGPDSGFPILHAAALDRLGSVKAGPFSHGRYPGAGQFGIVEIDDRGFEIEVTLSGRSWTGAEITSHTHTISSIVAPPTHPTEPT